MDGCIPDQTWRGLTSKCFCGTCYILRPRWHRCWGSTRKYIQRSPFRVAVAMIGFLQGNLMRNAEKILWSDCRFYFNKLYTLYEMLVLQFEKSRHFHPFPPLMMQFDDMILHVLLCSLSVVAKITAQILNHHRSSPTQ